MPKKEFKKWEFGDFQTPEALAKTAVTTLREQLSFYPLTILEPTCGKGSFLFSAVEAFPKAQRVIGADIKAEYIDIVKQKVERKKYSQKMELIKGDFFHINWAKILENTPTPILIIGNPPWVTNSDIGGIKGNNLPRKTNFKKNKGVDAITGKSNFDISEWMLLQYLEWMMKYTGAVAMLCKTTVARKILRHIWKNDINTISARMVEIDAMNNFGAAVDACFFIMEVKKEKLSNNCNFFVGFYADKPKNVIGYHDGLMLSDDLSFHKYIDLIGSDQNYIWRSGIKHDCSKIMELKIQNNRLINGNGDLVNIEDKLVFPLLKSSDLANGRILQPRLKVIVTQNKAGEDTSSISKYAPDTWKYLMDNCNLLDNRGSIIYKNKPRFSIFGVGPYSFAKWKVAISGFYKSLKFYVISPLNEKPVMLDDTAYFLSCSSREEANFICGLLNSDISKTLLSSMIFWSDKRPITIDVLKRLNIEKLAAQLGYNAKYKFFINSRTYP